MAKTIVNLYDQHTKHIKVDKKLLEQVRAFRMSWMRQADHITFLAGNTIGEQMITFSVSDEVSLMQGILKVSSKDLAKDLVGLDVINPSFRVHSNYKHHMMIYMIRKTFLSSLNDKLKTELVDEFYTIFAYMKLSSLIHNNFPDFLIGSEVALATYESLPKKFIIKKTGSWHKLIIYASNEFHPRIRERDMSEAGIHYKRVLNGSDDDMLAVIMGINTKLGRYMVNIRSVMADIMEGGIKGGTSSLMEDFGEGGARITELVNSSKHVHFIKEIIVVKTDFVNPRVIKVIAKLMGNINEEQLKMTLNAISDAYMTDRDDISKIIEVPIITGVNYLAKNEVHDENVDGEIESSLELLRGRWLASKGQSEEVKEFKDVAYKYAGIGTGKKSVPLLITLSIGVGLYIFLRAIVKNRI